MDMLTMPCAGETDAMLEKQSFVDNLLTTTWYDIRKEMFGDIFLITPLLNKMIEKGRVKERVPDGTHFEIPIMYGKLSQNQKWFGRGDTFGEKEAEFMTRLEYSVKNLGDSIVRFWDDERKNRGKAQILNYAEQVLANHKASLAQTMSEALWGVDSLAGGDKVITSLPTLISTTPAVGTIGGIDRSKNTYLRNQIKDFSGLTIDANLLDEMETMWNNCSKWQTMGRKVPDVIITTQTIYERYTKLCRAMGTYELNNNSRRVDLGMGEASFKGAEMFWDPNCTEGAMYFINTDTLEFPYDPQYYMQMTEWKSKHNSLDRYAQVVTVCNLCMNNFLKNGVIFNISTAA